MTLWWSTFSNWIDGLPDAWIGAAIAFAASIIVVVATNWGNNARLLKQLDAEAARQRRQLDAETEKQQKQLDADAARQQLQQAHDLNKLEMQLEHDGKQKSEDRKAAIRREVYTKAVEEVHGMLAFFGGLPERPLSKGKDDEVFQAFLKANAKVWLVAERDAAHLSRELTSLMGELFITMLTKAAPLRQAMEPVWHIDKQIAHFESEVLRTDTALGQAKERGESAEIIAAIGESWKSANELEKGLRAERVLLLKAMRPRRMARARETFDEMREVQRTIVKVVSALRHELHLPPDEQQFLAQLADMETRAMAALERVFGGTPPPPEAPAAW